MKVALIYPPAADPRAPQLALPSLAACLRPAGIETSLWDLGLTAVTGLLAPDRLADAATRLRRRGTARAAALEPLVDHTLARVDRALGTLRDERFYDPREYAAARTLLTTALEITAAAAPGAVRFNLAPIDYRVDGFDPARLADLVQVTADPALDLFDELWATTFFPALEADAPDLVGITLTNRQQLLPGLRLARRLRARGHRVVLGGATISKFADVLPHRPAFFEHFADFVVVYEGETALLELCTQLAEGGRFERVPNLIYRDGNNIRATAPRVEDVSRLPTPDFAGLPLDDYLAPATVLPILTGKGCYFNRCKFCDIPFINHISRKAYRVRAPETIAADVRTLAERFGARHFVITDEALSPRLLGRLAEALEPDAAADYRFTGYARLEPGFTPDLCARLKTMGLAKVFFGLESGAQRMLDHMDKGVRATEAPAVLRNFRAAGIDYHLFSIVGFPEETEADAAETFAFLDGLGDTLEAPGNTFDVHPFGLELRTPYWAEREALGLVVAPEVAERDLLIGLGPLDWQNPRGLSAADVERLVDGTFLPALRARYRRWHGALGEWRPGFEEYAALYHDAWPGDDFPFATRLPADADPTPCRLRFNPAWAPHDTEAGIALRALDRPVRVLSAGMYVALAFAPAHPAAELLAHLAPNESPATRAALRTWIDDRLAEGLLQLALDPPPDAAP